jgi:hypothetical protein
MHRDRNRRFRLLASIIVLIILSSGACNYSLQNQTTPDMNAVGTAAAQTVAVQMRNFTVTALALTTEIPVPVFSLTPTLADFTLTPTIAANPGPTIVANVDTNCREGPDTGYLRVGLLLANQQSTVRGRNADSSWWYIDHPSETGKYCWVWGGSTHVQGETAGLPVITAAPLPPTVAPTYGGVNVNVEFIAVTPCGDDTGMVNFFAENKGSVELKSMELTVRDIQAAEILFSQVVNSPFMPWINDCVGSINLAPDKVAYFGGIIPPPIPWKHRGRAIIQLCSDYNALGECQGFRIEFDFK